MGRVIFIKPISAKLSPIRFRILSIISQTCTYFNHLNKKAGTKVNKKAGTKVEWKIR